MAVAFAYKNNPWLSLKGPDRSWTLEGGEVIQNVHSGMDCHHPTCPIHALTNHKMRDWPQHWNGTYMERVCEHMVGHPDPDEHPNNLPWDHDCDHCCEDPVPHMTVFDL